MCVVCAKHSMSLDISHAYETFAEKREKSEASSYLMETDFIRELKELEVNTLKLEDRLVEIQDEKERLLNRVVKLELVI